MSEFISTMANWCGWICVAIAAVVALAACIGVFTAIVWRILWKCAALDIWRLAAFFYWSKGNLRMARKAMERAIDEDEPIESVDMWGGRRWRFW